MDDKKLEKYPFKTYEEVFGQLPDIINAVAVQAGFSMSERPTLWFDGQWHYTFRKLTDAVGTGSTPLEAIQKIKRIYPNG